MAEIAIGRGLTLAQLQVRVVEWLLLHREAVVMVALMSVAGVLRFWGLGDMALHHDESLHAQYSWYLYSGDGYQHNPLMHGPFLFHSGAATFFLFGDTDLTARIVPALFGTVLVGMPYLLRKQIGMPAVIIAALLLTFSPTLLYFSRFYRNDIYLAVWSLAMVICIWRYLDERKNLYLYALAAVMALSFATKEVTFITVAIILVFIDAMLAVELGGRRSREERVSGWRIAWRTFAIAPIAWLIAGLWPLLSARLRFGRERLPPAGDLMVLIGTLSLPQFAAGIQVLPFVGDRGYNVEAEDTLRVGAVTSLLLISVYVGLLWRPKVWAIAAACFFIPFVLLYTTFFTNLDGFFSGIWGSLDYWLDQHDVRRGDQPAYYYALLTPLYEFLPLILAGAGAAWLALRGDSLGRWLLVWLAGTFAGLSIAGEKMPWLETHIALPLILIAAIALARALDAFDFKSSPWLANLLAAAAAATATIFIVDGGDTLAVIGYAVAAALAAGLLVTLVRGSRDFVTRFGETLRSVELQLTIGVIAVAALIVGVLSFVAFAGIDSLFAVWILALIPLAIAGYLVAGVMRGSPAFGRAMLAVAVAVLATLTVRAGITATFAHDDTPVEMLVYTQTSPEIPQLRDRIDAIAASSGLGHNLPVVVDTTDSFAWPWAWYLRDYHSVSFVNVDEDYAPPQGAVLLVSRSNISRVDVSQYSQTPYKHRWWFNETYKGLNFEEAADVLASSQGRSDLANFFFYRRPAETTTGSIDGVAFFPNDLAGFDTGPAVEVEPRAPSLLPDGRIVIGSQTGEVGAAVPGEFWQPAGLHVDAEGNLWVADGLNHRIQKFDDEGNFLDSFGRAGGGPGLLNEPWGLAVDEEGFIYVADTWNHRIQKYSPDLELVTTWGTPGAGAASGPLELFGPRDIAIDADGTLWITDTGNKRVLQFSPDGEPLGSIGGEGSAPGEFNEPVGLEIDSAGDLLVTDAWNGRVQRISGGEATVAFSVGWTSTELLTKPYLTVLEDGRILVAVPESGTLAIFDSGGERLGEWQPDPTSMPVGVVALEDGGFAFSDIRRNEVQLVPADLVDGLFE